MPLVLLNRDPKEISDGLAQAIGGMLTKAVAEALDVPEEPDGRLAPTDVEVMVRDVRPNLDVNCVALAITVFANEFPARKANLDERREIIEEKVRKFLRQVDDAAGGRRLHRLCQGHQVFVWVRLAPASFGFV